jgi:hypothetical protein
MPKAHNPAIAIKMMIPMFMGIVYNKILMKRILFLILWVIPVLGTQAQGAIEIYANGHKYDSPQAYLTSKKTAPVNQKELSDASLHKIYVLSVENGVVSALQNFYQTWGQSDFISPEQLQEVIQQEVTTSEDPKLLISGAGKVRIMSLIERSDVSLDY